MSFAMFVLGVLSGAAALAFLLVPRLRAAVDSARAVHVALEHAERLAAERESAHERRLAELRIATAEKIALVAGNRQQLAEQMKAISSDTLQQVSEQVEKLAAVQREADRATAAGELGKRTEEIKRSLDPIAQNLKRVSDEVTRLEQDRRATHGQMRQVFESMSAELSRLRGETGTLVCALKRPQVRGAWGEMQLRNCVAAANMTEHVDFASQLSVNGSDGARLRPDLVVHLPAERDVVVDAKVPMDAYLRALGGVRRGRAAGAPAPARPPGAPAHRRARVEELPRAVRRLAGVRGHVHPERGRLLRRAGGRADAARA